MISNLCLRIKYRDKNTVCRVPVIRKSHIGYKTRKDGGRHGSSPFSGVSSLFTGVSDIFTSLFRRASLFPGVSPKLLIILVSTRFFSSSSLFSGVPDSCHQIFLKLHQLSLKLPITFFPC